VISKIIRILDALLTIITKVMEIVERRKTEAAARKIADEIDRSVAATPVDVLDERMRKYQRD
jgi:hypothetical protein